MITKHNLVVIIVSVLMAAAIPIVYKSSKKNEINYKTFHESAGWGYDIVVNGKLFIHQEYIPAIPQKKEFSTEAQAKETAQLVVYKLKNNKLPTLSNTEVDQICRESNQ